MRTPLLVLLALPTACVAAPHPASLDAPAPVFDPVRFFTGRTVGSAELKVIFSAPKRVAVQGLGHVDPDGTLVLDQRVDQEGKRPRTREWRLREVAPGRYAGTLTDAEGPVRADVHGNRLHLRYRMKDGGLEVEQWIYLQPGGREALNRMSISKFGIGVGRLEETIRKIG